MIDVEILSQGDEVVTGQTVDSNAAWLSERLTALGCRVSRHSTVGDYREDLTALVGEIAPRARVCICTGGLGPTEDDLTSECVAAAMAVPLEFDAEALEQIAAMFARFGRDMPASNRKQAMFPQGAKRLDNRWGTAPGFRVEHDGCLFFCLPGVPREMRKMYQAHIEPYLSEVFKLQAGELVTLRVTSLGESILQDRIGLWEEDEVVLAYRTIPPENHIKLRFPAGFEAARRDALVDELAQKLEPWVFHIDKPGEASPDGIQDTVAQQLMQADKTLSVLTWGDGGELLRLILSAPQHAQWLRHVSSLQYGAEALQDFPSLEQLQTLAEATRVEQGTDYCLVLAATSDIGESDKTPGTIMTLVADADGVEHKVQQRLGGKAALLRLFAATRALDVLRLKLVGAPGD